MSSANRRAAGGWAGAVAMSGGSPPRPGLLDGASPRSGGAARPLVAQPHQTDQRLGVLAGGDRLVQAVELPGDDLDALPLVRRRVDLAQAGGREQDHPL